MWRPWRVYREFTRLMKLPICAHLRRHEDTAEHLPPVRARFRRSASSENSLRMDAFTERVAKTHPMPLGIYSLYHLIQPHFRTRRRRLLAAY